MDARSIWIPRRQNLMQMTAPPPFIYLLYIIHDGSVVEASWECSNAEISGKNGDECQHQEEECILSCMLTRLIEGVLQGCSAPGLMFHTRQSKGPVKDARLRMFLPSSVSPVPLFPCSLFFPFVFNTNSHLSPFGDLNLVLRRFWLHLLVIAEGCEAWKPLDGVSTQLLTAVATGWKPNVETHRFCGATCTLIDWLIFYVIFCPLRLWEPRLSFEAAQTHGGAP